MVWHRRPRADGTRQWAADASCCEVWPFHGALQQHVRVHQPDVLWPSRGRGRDAAASAIPRFMSSCPCRHCSADRVAPLALHQRRASLARGAVLPVPSNIGAQPRPWGVPGRRRRQHPVPLKMSRLGTPDTDVTRPQRRTPARATIGCIAHHTNDFRLSGLRLQGHRRRHLSRGSVMPLLVWDPEETVSYIASIAYAAYLHGRSTQTDTKAIAA